MKQRNENPVGPYRPKPKNKTENRPEKSILRDSGIASIGALSTFLVYLLAHPSVEGLNNKVNTARSDLGANTPEAIQYAVKSKFSLDTGKIEKGITERRITEVVETCGDTDTYDIGLKETVRQESQYSILDPKMNDFIDRLATEGKDREEIKQLIISEQQRININIVFESDEPEMTNLKMTPEEFKERLMIITNTFHSQDITKYIDRIIIKEYEKGSRIGGEYGRFNGNKNSKIYININLLLEHIALTVIHEIAHITSTEIENEAPSYTYKKDKKRDNIRLCILYNQLSSQGIGQEESIKIIQDFVHNMDKVQQITEIIIDLYTHGNVKYSLNDSGAFRAEITDIIMKEFPELTRPVRAYAFQATIQELAEEVRSTVKNRLQASGEDVFANGAVNYELVLPLRDQLVKVTRNYEHEAVLTEVLAKEINIYTGMANDLKIKEIEKVRDFVHASMILASKFNNQAYLDVDYMLLRNDFNKAYTNYVLFKYPQALSDLTKYSEEMKRYLINNKKTFDMNYYLNHYKGLERKLINGEIAKNQMIIENGQKSFP